jgi:hypothetical protein
VIAVGSHPARAALYLVLAPLGLLALVVGRGAGGTLDLPLDMAVASSTLSRLALLLGSNTFSPYSVSEYALIPHQEVSLSQFFGDALLKRL